MRKALVGAALFVCLAACQPILAQDRCEHARDIDLTTSAEGAAVALIRAAAGELIVEGGGGDAIVIKGRACASDARRLETMDVEVSTRGDHVEIVTAIPEISGWSWGGGRYAYIDLRIEVPAGLDLEVEDGSGNLDISDVASVDLADGSGNIEIRGVAGDVRVEDGSGNLTLEEIGGEVWIEDGSGNVTVRGVGGVTVVDGSGSIDVEGVRGSVLVRSDGSGSIAVASVDGDFTVENDGSGGIRHNNVAGTVKIPKQR